MWVLEHMAIEGREKVIKVRLARDKSLTIPVRIDH